ncbi:two component system response regulator [Enterobacter huaxiensis]|uniref:two component system response regulator n=1 Tax=Enterobacter huaxiensis TaxID=2494702 RepID=UPI0021D81DF6|nr:two component system response regulator [Enterobacter huaxiensis]
MTNHKILIVDDHELIVHGISTLLAPYPRFEISGHTVDGRDVYNACIASEPNIVILDLGLPGINGMELIPQLRRRWPEMRILIYSAHNEEFMAARALRAGADGYALKSSSQQTILSALQMLAVNRPFIDPALNRDAIDKALSEKDDMKSILTSRELQVLKLIIEGNTNALIGEQLHISIKTVETHRLNIMRKLNVHKVTDLMNCAQRLRLITMM